MEIPMMKCLGAIAFLAFLSPLSAAPPTPTGHDAASDWQKVVELDAGPSAKPGSQQEARAVAASHVARQEKALRDFLRGHPGDPHAFEGQLRLSRALQIRAGLENSEA